MLLIFTEFLLNNYTPLHKLQEMNPCKFLVILLFLIGTSFTSNKPLKSKVNPEEITNLQYFEPISYIYFINKDNKDELSESMSQASMGLIRKFEKNYRNELHLQDEILFPDTIIRNRVKHELELNIGAINRFGNLYCLKPTPVIDSILLSKGKRFGLLMSSIGFTREKGNYGQERAKFQAKYFLSNGWDNEMPMPMQSALYAVIFDAKEHDVAFFGKSDRSEQPLKEDLLEKRFTEIFQGYLLKNRFDF